MKEDYFKGKAWDTFLKNTPKYVYWKGLDLNYLGCNAKYAKLLGLTHESEIVGKSDMELALEFENPELCAQVHHGVIESKTVVEDVIEKFKDVSGQEYEVCSSVAPMFDDNGDVIGTVGWFWDMKTIKNLEIQLDDTNRELIEYNTQLEISNRKLEQANLNLEQFTFAASHDLKSPLHLITNFSQILLDENEDVLDDEAKEYLGYIDKSAKRMYSMIESVLNYARVNSNALEEKKTTVSVKALIEEQIKELEENFLQSRQVAINLNFEDIELKCHQHLLAKVFLNLIKNGLLFNSSALPTVEVYCEVKDVELLFTITDNGIGIEDKFKQVVFRPFKRLHSKDDYEGSGIGLSIAERVLAVHKGKIWIEDNPQGGSIVKFTVSRL